LLMIFLWQAAAFGQKYAINSNQHLFLLISPA
jgi:hypothetical protein